MEKERRVRLGGERRRNQRVVPSWASGQEVCSNAALERNLAKLSLITPRRETCRCWRACCLISCSFGCVESRNHDCTHVKDCGKLPGERTIFARAARRNHRAIEIAAIKSRFFRPRWRSFRNCLNESRDSSKNLDRGL